MAETAVPSRQPYRLLPVHRGHRLAAIAACLVYLLGTIRILAVVLHDPVLGYANNFDMVRTQACIQVWPADPAHPPGYPSFAGPLNRYLVREVPEARGFCVPTPDLLFGYLGRVVAFGSDGTSSSIRVFGVLRAVAVAALALGFLLLMLRRGSPAELLVHALVYLVVVADPANTLYANTFYREFTVLLFAYASMLFLWSLGRFGPGWLASVGLAVSLLLLGLSSRQHLLLPLPVLAGLLVAARFRLRPLARAIVLVVLAGLLATAGQAALYRWLGRPGTYLHSIDLANATDTFLGAVLPAADDPVEAARLLGLPPGCAAHGGKTWYSPGVQEHHPCPEVLDVPRARILLVVLDQPRSLLRLTHEGLLRLRPWALRYLGSVGGLQFGYAGEIAPTLSDGIDLLPDLAVTLLFLLPLPAALCGVAVSLLSRAGPEARSGAAVVVALAGSAWVVFYSALFGDGTFEFQKHTHLFTSLLLSLLILALVMVPGALAEALRKTGRRGGRNPRETSEKRPTFSP